MVCLDLDHPDIEEFIDWKVVEEQKVAAMVTGSKICAQRLNAVLKACHTVGADGQMKADLDAKTNPVLSDALAAARRDMVPEAYIQRMFSYAQQGFTHFVFHEYDTNWDGKAYQTVSGQNSNNSVRIPNEFFAAFEADSDWQLKRRTDGKVVQDDQSAGSLGSVSLGRPGFAPIRARSTTRRSMNGIPALKTAGSMRPIPARNTCSSTTRHVTSRR